MTWYLGWWPTGYKSTLPRGTVMFLRLSSISDPKWSSTCWQHICVATVRRSWPWRWPEYESPHHCNRQDLFCTLWQIRSLCHSLTPDALLTLLRALVITKLDFCCSTLDGVFGTLLQRLQSVLNAAARLVYSARRSEHTTPLLQQLHCTGRFTALARGMSLWLVLIVTHVVIDESFNMRWT